MRDSRGEITRVVEGRPDSARRWAVGNWYSSDLPEPVGVLRMTFFSSNSSRMAFSCAG